MVPKTGTRLPKLQFSLSDNQLAALIGSALREELGGSRRAAKTIMGWTGVSDHTARAWLHGRKSPNSVHLLALAANSSTVMSTVLRITGHHGAAVEIDLGVIEQGLQTTLEVVRKLLSRGP